MKLNEWCIKFWKENRLYKEQNLREVSDTYAISGTDSN